MKKELGIFILLLALCGVAAVYRPDSFLSSFNLQALARWTGIYGIFGIGLGMVIITGGIDLSVGSVFALLGVIFAMLLRQWEWHWGMALSAMMVMAIALGVLHGWLIAKIRMQPFVVTLCGLLIYRSIARYIANDETKGFGVVAFGWLRPLVTQNFHGVPMPFIWLVLIAIIMWFVLHRSVYGRYVFAVGRNEQAARYSGISSRLIIGSTYVVSMVLTAISGVMLALDINSVSPADFGQSMEMYGIAAAVLGGCSLRGGEGSIIGIVIGTAVLQVLYTIVNLFEIKSSLNGTVMGTVILVGVLVDQVMTARRKRKIVQPAAIAPAPPPAAAA